MQSAHAGERALRRIRYTHMLVTSLLPLSDAHAWFAAYHMLPLPLLRINAVVWRNPHAANTSYPASYR